MRLFDMAGWLHALLRHDPADGPPAAGELDVRLRDADGDQLAQRRAIMHDELESLDETSTHAPADLGLANTELARGMRARTRRRFRKAR